MRYQDWDVLLFPANSKAPIQEFRTDCQVVQCQEYCHGVNNSLLLPTVTSFIPGLQTGERFRVSIHSWHTPEPSTHLQRYSQHPESAIWEACVFIDGRLIMTRYINRDGLWPVVITSDEENADRELVFPEFHHELLNQQYWSAADDLSRIKVVISEGFPRASDTLSFERVKPVVAFSFQHTPLEVLERSSIAWPNVSMWRSSTAQWRDSGTSPPEATQARLREALQDAFSVPGSLSPAPYPWVNVRKASSTDTSMPDYSSYNVSDSGSRLVSGSVPAKQDMDVNGAFDYLNTALLPTVLDNRMAMDTDNKENQVDDDSPVHDHAFNTTPTTKDVATNFEARTSSATKSPTRHVHAKGIHIQRLPRRRRVITQASVKVIDSEDEPLRTRTASSRRALSAVANNIV